MRLSIIRHLSIPQNHVLSEKIPLLRLFYLRLANCIFISSLLFVDFCTIWLEL